MLLVPGTDKIIELHRRPIITIEIVMIGFIY
nr:MAG TPA: hypothetical protein [Caudoviricetes sp.]